MTDSPRTVSRARKLARKVVPLPIRRTVVRWVDSSAAKWGEPGRHHKGGVSR